MANKRKIKLCKEKETQLLNKYFGNIVKEAAIERPETIGEYTSFYYFTNHLPKEFASLPLFDSVLRCTK